MYIFDDCRNVNMIALKINKWLLKNKCNTPVSYKHFNHTVKFVMSNYIHNLTYF